MKLAITLFAISTVGKVNAHGLRHLQTCPTPGAGGVCQMNIDPVKCGNLNCEYDNPCIATKAGFAESQCTKANPECPVPDANMPCTANYDPLTCGPLNCEYDNECLANLAGFDIAADCTKVYASCPTPMEGACTLNIAPVVCGEFDCEYDNACLANLAGFAVEAQCTEVQAECPEMGLGMCTMEYMPLKCGPLECEYSNPCNAGLAGFNAETECTKANPEQPGQQLGASPEAAIECPVGEGMCTMEYNPVKCGACEYSNPCGAELAGFNPETECTSALPQCPPMGEGMCTMEYMPVKCGELECEYDNACNAGLAGFNAETECTSATPAAQQAQLGASPEAAIECPVGEGMCTMEYNPVKCGACEYSNPCGAELAGFNPETECTSALQCPPMGEGMCTMEYMPVKCGELECEYSNACSAGLAGFNVETECTSAIPEQPSQQLGASPEAAIECPVGEGMCTMEYNPVKCGACEYSNPCGAELAGFNPETECVSAQCPVAGEGICTMEYMPVKCGELECEYPNACNAGLAGFNAETECTSAIPGEEADPELYTATTVYTTNGEPAAEEEASLDPSEDSSASTMGMAAGSLVAALALLMA